jgi:hypothetical protein
MNLGPGFKAYPMLPLQHSPPNLTPNPNLNPDAALPGHVLLDFI